MDNNVIDTEILSNLKNTFNDDKEKEISSLFKAFKGDSTSDNLLKALTKGELDNIRKSINVAGTSSLKKNELAEHLDNYIKNNLEFIFKNYITQNEFQYINLVIKNNGTYVYNHNDYSVVKSLKLLGILFTVVEDKIDKVVIPKEYINEINTLIGSKDIEEEVIRNNKIVKIIEGLLYYYGIAPFDVLWEKIKSVIDVEIDKDKASTFIVNYSNRNDSFKVYKNYLYTSQLFNVDHIIKEQEKRSELDYKNVDLNTILFASDNIKNVWNIYEKDLYNYLVHLLGDNNEKLGKVVNAYIYGVKNDCKLPELLNFITSITELENQTQVYELAQYLNEVSNNCSLWVLKGYTSNEIYKNDDKSNIVITTNKVGRNDNCPCGSGKKYKKCCGKN